jgi:O-antigen ligase
MIKSASEPFFYQNFVSAMYQSRSKVLYASKLSGGSAAVRRPGATTPTSAYPLGFESLPSIGAFALLVLLLALAPSYLSGFWPASFEYAPQSVFSGITAIACLLMALRPADGLADGAPKQKFGATSWCVAGFLAWLVLSAVTTVYRHDTILELARVGTGIAWFFMAKTLLREGFSGRGWNMAFDRRVLWLLGAVILGALPVVIPPILGFLQTRSPQLPLFFYNSNLYANFCAMAIPLALTVGLLAYRATSERSAKTAALVIGVGLAALIAVGLVVSASKGGFLSAFVGLFVFALFIVRARGKQVAAIIRRNRVAFIIGVVLFLLVGGGIAGKTVVPRLMAARGSENHSTMFRVYTWRGTINMIKARPVQGFGPGSFPSAYPLYAEAGYTRSAHQSWLQIGAESGVPALLLILAVCGLALGSAWRAARTPRWPVAAGASACVVAFMAHGLTDAGWGISSILLLLMVALALLDVAGSQSEVAATETIGNSKAVSEGSRLRFQWLPFVLLLAYGSLAAQNAQGGEDARALSRQAAQEGNGARALEAAQDAVAADSSGVRPLTNLAQTQESAGQDASPTWKQATEARPTAALTWLQWAEARVRKGESPREQFDRAVALDANDTSIRWARAEWLLGQSDKTAQQQGWADLEKIGQLLDEPYGRYPATPEIVNFDYVRALLKLTEREIERGDKKQANLWLDKLQPLLDVARENEERRAEMMKAMAETAMGAPESENVADFEEQAKNLRARAK